MGGTCLRSGSFDALVSARQEGCTVRVGIKYDNCEEENPHKSSDAQTQPKRFLVLSPAYCGRHVAVQIPTYCQVLMTI